MTPNFLKEFYLLLYPAECPSCDQLLIESERGFCLHCESELAYLNYPKGEDTPIEKLFWGLTPIQRATAFVQFVQGGITQTLLHELKYRSNYKVGQELGLRFGQQLVRTQFFSEVDYIVPVPLHFLRKWKRGYNQSEMIAKGMEQAMSIPVNINNLVRRRSNATQTKKNRLERADNVQNIFALQQPQLFENKHILLVDDVVTTGATLQACAQALLESKGARVSVATVAKA